MTDSPLKQWKKRKEKKKNKNKKEQEQEAYKKKKKAKTKLKPKETSTLQTTHKDDDQVCECIYCSEVYEDPPQEDWLQCIGCKEWYHEKCGSGEPICDLCV